MAIFPENTVKKVVLGPRIELIIFISIKEMAIFPENTVKKRFLIPVLN